MGLSTYKYVDCSMTHITKRDNNLLIEGWIASECPVTAYQYEYGFWIMTPPADEYDERMKEIGEFGFSKSFQALISAAFDVGANWIKLDRDGEIHGSLVQHKW